MERGELEEKRNRIKAKQKDGYAWVIKNWKPERIRKMQDGYAWKMRRRRRNRRK